MSSKRRLRRRRCERKRRYASQTEAVQAIIGMKKAGVCRPDTHSYHCDLCGGWHVGRASKNLGHRKSIKLWEML